MRARRVDELESLLVKRLNEYFGSRADDYSVREATDSPFRMLSLEFVVYNYFLVRVELENDSVFFSIVQPGVVLKVLEKAVSVEDMPNSLSAVDAEIRLRIPDKYLAAKGW